MYVCMLLLLCVCGYMWVSWHCVSIHVCEQGRYGVEVDGHHAVDVVENPRVPEDEGGPQERPVSQAKYDQEQVGGPRPRPARTSPQ